MTPQSREVLVQAGKAEKISVGFLRRDPPLKHHLTRACHREQIAIPGWRGGVGRQRAVDAVVMDELL
jgi:hypothetical protein